MSRAWCWAQEENEEKCGRGTIRKWADLFCSAPSCAARWGSAITFLTEGVQMVGFHGLVDKEEEASHSGEQQELHPHRQGAPCTSVASRGRRRGDPGR